MASRSHGATLLCALLATAALYGCAGTLNGQTPADFSSSYEETKESIVFIRVKRSEPEGKENSSGSGVVISSREISPGRFETWIATNNHVTQDAKEFYVDFGNGEKVQGEPFGSSDKFDLSAVRTETGRPHKPATLGDSDRLRIGECAYIIGNPLGSKRTLNVGYIGNLKQDPVTDMIIFDGLTNSGNSGGGLFNCRRELVGIVHMATRSGSLGFAISVNKLRKHWGHLAGTKGTLQHGFLGVAMRDLESLDEKSMKDLNVPHPLTVERGVVVADLVSGSPAEKAGILRGDIIVAIDGQAVSNGKEVVGIILDRKIGEKIIVTLIRGSSRHEIKVEIGAPPPPPKKEEKPGLKTPDSPVTP